MPDAPVPKTILITGTSSGFGLLTAARLSAQGHIVYATMRDLTKKDDLLKEVQRRGGEVIVRALDVTQPYTIAAVLKEIVTDHGRIDVVINNAGYGLGGFFEDLSDEDIRHQMDVNFFGVQNVCRAVLPSMRANKKGLIINISSIAGRTATPCLGAYNASKWALEGFSESLYYEVSPFNIKVVLVEPGPYKTKIFGDNARYGKNFDNPDSPYYFYSRKIKSFVEKNLSHKGRDPEPVAALVARIIESKHPNARYITDWQSRLRIWASAVLPPSVYNFIFQRIIYGNR